MFFNGILYTSRLGTKLVTRFLCYIHSGVSLSFFVHVSCVWWPKPSVKSRPAKLMLNVVSQLPRRSGMYIDAGPKSAIFAPVFEARDRVCREDALPCSAAAIGASECSVRVKGKASVCCHSAPCWFGFLLRDLTWSYFVAEVDCMEAPAWLDVIQAMSHAHNESDMIATQNGVVV